MTFVRGELKDEITKRVIANRQTGSSWHFKRFDILNVIVFPVSEAKKLSGCTFFVIHQ